jgi:hypothetical protein
MKDDIIKMIFKCLNCCNYKSNLVFKKILDSPEDLSSINTKNLRKNLKIALFAVLKEEEAAE